MNTRNRVSGTDWERIFAEQARSGLSIKRFCLEHGIKPTSYYSATKRQRQAPAKPTVADSSARNASPAQDPTTDTAANVSKRATFVSVQVSDESDDVPRQSSAIRVQLRGGHQLWVGAEFDAAHLRRLVAVLESAS
jgi:transposase-like protein